MAYTAIVSGNKNVFRQKALNLAMLNKDMNDLLTYNTLYKVDTGKVNDEGETVWEDAVVLSGKVYQFEGFDADGNIIKNALLGEYADMQKAKTIKGSVDRGHLIRNTKSQAQQHELPVYMGGKKYVVVMKSDPQLAIAVEGHNNVLKGTVEELSPRLGKWVRTLSALNTSKNPAFIPVNFIRDIGYAVSSQYIKDEGDVRMFLKNIRHAKGAIHRHLKGTSDPKNNKHDEMFERFILAGGRTGYAHLEDINAHRDRITKELKRMSGTNSRLDKMTQNQVIKMLGNSLEYMAMMSEDISRFATFLTSKEKGRSDSRSALDSKDSTVNFNRKGRVAGFLGMFYMFANAAIQGGANFIGLGIKNKKQMSKVAMTFMAMGFLSAELMRFVWPDDDEDEEDNYSNINEFLRDNYLIMPNPAWIFGKAKDKYISVPLPHGFRFFNSLGTMASDIVHGRADFGASMARITNNLINTFSPVSINTGVLAEKGEINIRPFVPSWVTPFYDINQNEDFANRKVFKEMFTPVLEQSTPEWQKGLKNTNKTLVQVSRLLNKIGGGTDELPADWQVDEDGNYMKDNIRQVFNFNPAKLEYVITSYTGGAGQFFNDLLKTTTSAIELATGQPDAEILANDVPVLKRMYRSNYKKGYIGDYYELKRQVAGTKIMLKSLEREDERMMLMKRNPENQRREAVLKYIEPRMKAFENQMEKYSGDKEKYDEIIKKRDEMLEKAFNKLNQERE
jgi:hypothetical protein